MVEVGQGFVPLAGKGAGEVQVPSGGEDRAGVTGVEFFQPGGEPVVAVAGEQPCGQVGQFVQTSDAFRLSSAVQ